LLHNLKNLSSGEVNRRLFNKLGAAVALTWMLTMSSISATEAQELLEPGVFAVIYERGADYVDGTAIAEQASIPEHMAYAKSLGESYIAGGLLGTLTNDTVVGMVVFEADSLSQATDWVSKDPGIVAGTLSGTVRQWQTTNIKAYSQE
jgi:hypothetical protein